MFKNKLRWRRTQSTEHRQKEKEEAFCLKREREKERFRRFELRKELSKKGIEGKFDQTRERLFSDIL